MAGFPYKFLVLSFSLPLVFFSQPGWGKEDAPKKQPVEISADSMHYDQKAEVAKAEGNVDVTQGKRVVKSDKIRYDKKHNVINAEGNVSFKDDTGDRYYASDVELRNNMADGDLTSLTAKLVDNSTLTADTAKRRHKTTLILKNATYTPCTICTDEGKKAPMWQFRAKKVTMDQEKQTVRYKHAFFDVYGVPVFYTPYFSHPTSNADRKSGLLTPEYSHDSLLGNTAKIPYYLNLAPDYDLVLTPFLTSKEGLVMEGEFRQLTQYGRYTLRGSITRPDARDDFGQRIAGEKDTRGYIEGDGLFQVNDDWTAGFAAKRASDDTYLQRYDYSDEDTLTSRVYAERIKNRDYTVVQALSFQGLNIDDDPDLTPYALPYAKTHMESAAGRYGGRWGLDADALLLGRQEGDQSRRISVGGGWSAPYILPSGHVFNFRSGLRGDLYSVDRDNTLQANPDMDSSIEERLVPEMELDWRFPLVRENISSRIIIEPVVNLIASPYGNNPDEIPNEDSQVTQLSDENLFSANRYTGIDRVENGPRANYGFQGGVHGNNGQHVDFLFGQNYRVKEDSSLLPSSGLADNFSDYVGRVVFRTAEMFDMGYRFRLDKDDLAVNQSEVMAGIYYAPVRFDVDYIEIDEAASLTGEAREEVYGRMAWDVNREWTLATDARRDLTGNGGMISSGASVIFHGDCLDFTTSLLREFTRDRDIEPSSAVLFQIHLRNIN